MVACGVGRTACAVRRTGKCKRVPGAATQYKRRFGPCTKLRPAALTQIRLRDVHAMSFDPVSLSRLPSGYLRENRMTDVLVVGAGPAGVMAALRAADLGASTALVASADFGGMAANDGPVPVRTLAHASRLLRDARQLGQYGVTVSEPVLDYSQLLARVHEVVRDVRTNSSLRQQIDSLGVTVHEQTGMARFVDPYTIERDAGRASPTRRQGDHLCRWRQPAFANSRLRADKHPQRCLGADFRAAVNACHWRRCHGGANRLGL